MSSKQNLTSNQTQLSTLARISKHKPLFPNFETLAISPDGQFMAFANFEEARIISTQTGEFVFRSFKPSQQLIVIIFSPDNLYIAHNHSVWIIKIWDTIQEKYINISYNQSFDIYSMRFTPDSSILSTLLIHERIILLWDCKSGTILKHEQPKRGKMLRCLWNSEIYSHYFTPNRKLIIVQGSNRKDIFDVKRKKHIRTIRDKYYS